MDDATQRFEAALAGVPNRIGTPDGRAEDAAPVLGDYLEADGWESMEPDSYYEIEGDGHRARLSYRTHFGDWLFTGFGPRLSCAVSHAYVTSMGHVRELCRLMGVPLSGGAA